MVRRPLPKLILHAGVAATFVVELLLPLLIFAPRNLRRIAAAGFVLLEVLIMLTGNYNFFNVLTIVLCLALLDDRMFGAAARGDDACFACDTVAFRHCGDGAARRAANSSDDRPREFCMPGKRAFCVSSSRSNW